MEIENINRRSYQKNQKVMVNGLHVGKRTAIIKDKKGNVLFGKKYLIEFTGGLGLLKPLWIPEERILFRVCK